MKHLLFIVCLFILSCSFKNTKELAFAEGERIIKTHMKDPDTAKFQESHVIASKSVTMKSNGVQRELWILHYNVKAKNSFGAYVQEGYCAFVITEPNNLKEYFGTSQAFECDRDKPNNFQFLSILSKVQWQAFIEQN